MPPDMEIMECSDGVCDPKEIRVWQKDIFKNYWPDEHPAWETTQCEHTRLASKAVFLR